MKENFACRACGHAPGKLVLDLGVHPLANNLLRPEDLASPEPRFPLSVFVCPECSLLQLAEIVPPVRLFSEYLYFSSFSETMLAHAQTAAQRYCREFALGPEQLVVEIASNDGYLLQFFQKAGVRCLGVEPAANIARAAQAKGIETRVNFFDAAFAQTLRAQHRQADLILGNNVFAHVPQLGDFITGLKLLLKPQGRIILEFPDLMELVSKNEFDTIYHEHVFYFALTPLVLLFRKHGLEIIHVEQIAIHGGSLRVFAAHAGEAPVQSSVENRLHEEQRRGVNGWDFYAAFAGRVRQTKQTLVQLLLELRQQGKSVAAYGAAAKGSTLLNFCGLDSRLIDFVVDRSPHKQGRLTPGTHLPILPPEALVQRNPDYTLLLTWNFAEEILRQQEPYRKAGGKFIVPIPEVNIV